MTWKGISRVEVEVVEVIVDGTDSHRSDSSMGTRMKLVAWESETSANVSKCQESSGFANFIA
jgi:hypothetical protein